MKKSIMIILCIWMLALSACRSGEDTSPSQKTDTPAPATDTVVQSPSVDDETEASFESVRPVFCHGG